MRKIHRNETIFPVELWLCAGGTPFADADEGVEDIA
jgi:hypothetical protein